MANTFQEWMNDNFRDHITLNIWTSTFKIMDSLDYYIYDVVDTDVNQLTHNTMKSVMYIMIIVQNFVQNS